MHISDIGEHALIERIRARVPDAPAWVIAGIGDDAAVIAPERGCVDVVTTDSLVEDVHFRRAWTSMRDVGYKALAVNVSDLAAMGAEPRAATLSLALPASLAVTDFDELIDGFLELARAVRVQLVGGNLTKSPGPVVIDVTLIGSARRRRLMMRSGGKPGHLLYVTGTVGGAARTLEAQRSEGPTVQGSRPPVRLRTGLQVSRNKVAMACVDVSDGLADAVAQLAKASGTGAELNADLVPRAPGATIEQALYGGEDYELLFAVPKRWRGRFERIAGRDVTVTAVGELIAPRDLWVTRDGTRAPLGAGFSHF
jgi:thiamine-monophosphate kinase